MFTPFVLHFWYLPIVRMVEGAGTSWKISLLNDENAIFPYLLDNSFGLIDFLRTFLIAVKFPVETARICHKQRLKAL